MPGVTSDAFSGEPALKYGPSVDAVVGVAGARHVDTTNGSFALGEGTRGGGVTAGPGGVGCVVAGEAVEHAPAMSAVTRMAIFT
jgi:hypothetical protein